METMKRLLKDRYVWVIGAFVIVFVTIVVFQDIVEVSWLPSEKSFPILSTGVELGLYGCIIVLSSARFKLRGGVIAVVAGIIVLMISHKTHLVAPDILAELVFAALAGIFMAVVTNQYVLTIDRLKVSNDKLQDETRKLRESNDKLQKALASVKTISGLLPICASCKKVRTDEGYFESVEEYIRKNSTAQLDFTFCKECWDKLHAGGPSSAVPR